MLALDGLAGLVMIGLWIFCIIDVITTPEGACRNLPKIVWLLIVVLLAVPGSIVWLIAGRPWNAAGTAGTPGRASTRLPARPGRRATQPVAPDDDEEFLAGLRARAEEQRRRAREQQQGDQDGGHPAG